LIGLRQKNSIIKNYGDDIWGSFEKHISPKLGTQPIHELHAPQVIEVLKPIESRGNLKTVKRLTQRLNDVMTFAVNIELIAKNPFDGIKASFKRPKKKTCLRYPLTNYPSLQSFWHW
jgi:integrase